MRKVDPAVETCRLPLVAADNTRAFARVLPLNSNTVRWPGNSRSPVCLAARAPRTRSARSGGGGAPSTVGGRRTAGGACSTSGGRRRTASGARSTSSGGRRTVGGARSTASGGWHTAGGACSTSGGGRRTASGARSTPAGRRSTAGGGRSTASGRRPAASGEPPAAGGAPEPLAPGRNTGRAKRSHRRAGGAGLRLRLHEEDLRAGYGRVHLPHALARKYPRAAGEWSWRYVFPASQISRDPRSGEHRRHHLHERPLQRAGALPSKRRGPNRGTIQQTKAVRRTPRLQRTPETF
jgi:hypothetical protein